MPIKVSIIISNKFNPYKTKITNWNNNWKIKNQINVFIIFKPNKAPELL